MRIKKRFKGIALVALLAVAGLFGISSVAFSNHTEIKEAEATAAFSNPVPDYIFVRVATDTGKIKNSTIDQCQVQYWSSSGAGGSKRGEVNLRDHLYEVGPYTYAKVAVSRNTNVGEDFLVNDGTGSGGKSNLTENQDFYAGFDTFVVTLNGKDATLWIGGEYVRGYHSKLICFDLSKSDWSSVDVSTIQFSLDGGSSFNSGLVNACTDFFGYSGSKLCYFEVPGVTDTKPDDAPSSVILRVGASGTGKWITSSISLKPNSNYAYQLEASESSPNASAFSLNDYTVSYANYDGTIFETYEVPYAEYTPSYAGSTPVKPSEGTTFYEFTGWDNDPSTTVIRDNTTFTATFSSTSETGKDATIMIGVYDNIQYDFFNNTTVAIYAWTTNDVITKTVEAHRIPGTNIAYATIPAGVKYVKVLRISPQSGAPSLPFDGWPADHSWTINNQWNDMTLQKSSEKLTKNLAYISGWDSGNCGWDNSAKVILPQGMPVYVENEMPTWFSDSATTYIYHSLNSSYYGYGSWTAWQKMTRVGDTNTLYYVPSSTIVADLIILTRNKKDTPGWDDKYNQTTDITVSNGYYNTCVVNILNTTSSSNYNWDPKGISETMESYGTFFLNMITCDGQGSITGGTAEEKAAKWAAVTDHYNGLGLTTQGSIWKTTPSQSGTQINQAMARYDYIVFFKQYPGYNDYIGRGNSGSGRIISSINSFNPFDLLRNGENNITTIIIVVVSSISLLSITALSVFLVKKRKTKQSN